MKDKKAYLAAYYKANRERLLAKAKQYHHDNREQRLAYHASWRARNQDKVKTTREAYKPRWTVLRAAQYTATKEESKAKARAWNAAHKERVLERSQIRWRTQRAKCQAEQLAWRRGNPEKVRRLSRDWLLANKEKVIAKNALRRARILQAVGELTVEDRNRIAEIYRARARLSKDTGVVYHVDHVMPLARGGKHHPNNLQLLPAVENLKKGARVQHAA